MAMNHIVFILSWDIPIAELKGTVAVHDTFWLGSMVDSLIKAIEEKVGGKLVTISYVTPQICPNHTNNYVIIDNEIQDDCVVKIQIINSVGFPAV